MGTIRPSKEPDVIQFIEVHSCSGDCSCGD